MYTKTYNMVSEIPTEILREIFLFHSDSSPAAAQVLSSVNQRWRAVTTAFPDLWLNISSNINVNYPPISLLELWVDRSTNNLIQIGIESFPTYRSGVQKAVTDQDNYLRRVLEVLVPHCHRWGALKLTLTAHHAKFFRVTSLESAVALKTVVLNMDYVEEPVINVVATIPSPLYLRWESACETYAVVNGAPQLPWDRLVYVALSWCRGWEDLAEAMTWCTSAKVLELHGPTGFEEINFLPERIVLPSLRTLYIDGSNPDLLAIFPNLDSPNLSVLRIDISSGSDPEFTDVEDPYHRLSTFLRSGRHGIRRLKMDIATRLSEEDLIITLEACLAAAVPSVEICLNLEQSGIQDFTWITERLEKVRVEPASRTGYRWVGWT
ncbi:hypothetical protein P691DRAFT_778071 [Macrolepiota fuliginosa MF-IS2]|uniref:F-box domain-containing protein n=1 Tax=Macrolepiota fuliginosa MF-IS2 TaxID=1400762 RepID=A0A9P5X7R9_9AGAR|nr:hypothetical protein P691DRAFT_778071 [Macrolepiota fuliginosa MF-IS2]